jgi:predicted DCC family thiol-disulfide oxidoreductase YuxK
VQSFGKVTVYDDGRCPFCQWTQQKVEAYDRERRLEFRDYNLPAHAAETPFSVEQLSQKMHVRTADGQWQSGFFGWLAILKVLPRWRWLARVLAVPPLRWVGPLVYRFVAGNRYRIPKFLLRWLGAPPPCDDSCAVPGSSASRL